jgi:hypothetical protein
MSEIVPEPRPSRRRLAPLIWLGSAAAALVVALGVSGTLSGFTASIDNTTNTAATGTLLMTETGVTNATGTCYSNGTANGAPDSNAGICATINKFGGSTTMAPGVAGPAVTVSISNNGTINAGVFKLTPDGACTQSVNGTVNGSATDLCSKLNVTISSGTGTSGNIFSGTMAALGTSSVFFLPAINAGSSSSFTFQVTLDPSAGNSYQGLKASTGLTWSFAQ